MNQEVKAINVVLESNHNIEYLCFKFDKGDSRVNLNSADNQAELQQVFSELLHELINTPIELVLIIQSGFSLQLYIDVCQEYIKSLNKEIREVRKRLPIEG